MNHLRAVTGLADYSFNGREGPGSWADKRTEAEKSKAEREKRIADRNNGLK